MCVCVCVIVFVCVFIILSMGIKVTNANSIFTHYDFTTLVQIVKCLLRFYAPYTSGTRKPECKFTTQAFDM